MRSRTVLRAAALVVIAGLLLASVPATLVQAQPGQSQVPSAAEAYVRRIAAFINNTLALARAHGVELNASLREAANESLQLIAWARANLTVNETLSVELATRASIVFAPVAEYVWRSLPADVREEMRARALEKIVSQRIALLKRIEERLREVQNETGANLTLLIERINATIALLEQAQQYLEEGNVSAAASIVRQTGREIAVEVRNAYVHAYTKMKRVATISILVLHLADHVGRLTSAVNRTLQALNQTGQEENLTEVLQGLVNRNRALLARAERLEQAYPLKNTSDPVYRAIVEIITGLNTSQLYLEMALNASIAGNMTWVAINLTLALQALNSTMANLTSLQLPVTIKHRVIEIVRETGKLRKARDIIMNRTYAALSIMLDRKLSHLQELYEKYQEGKVPQWKVKTIFMIEKQNLLALKASLPADAPAWLIEKIDAIIAWIDEHMP